MKIFITGGSSGLGKSITEELAVAYPAATIYFTFNSSSDAAAAIEAKYKNTVALQLNFKDAASVGSMTEKIQSLEIDVLINNAIAGKYVNHFHKTDTAIFTQGFSENILPAIQLTAGFIKAARKKKSGKIITVLTSALGGMPETGMSAYIAEKAYLLSLCKSWATENIQFNIQSNAVSPEFMDTTLNNDVDFRIKEALIKGHPLKRLLTTEEVAQTVKFLVEAPAHFTGQNIFINSGRS
jgi:NAD(P)-dependent dehydrogenase (short-subunit alcohol dehydrogenase family)